MTARKKEKRTTKKKKNKKTKKGKRTEFFLLSISQRHKNRQRIKKYVPIYVSQQTQDIFLKNSLNIILLASRVQNEQNIHFTSSSHVKNKDIWRYEMRKRWWQKRNGCVSWKSTLLKDYLSKILIVCSKMF